MTSVRMFGERLKLLREERGLSVRGVARALDLHATTIYGIEAGRQAPSFILVGRLAALLHVDEVDLFTFPQTGVRHELIDLTRSSPLARLLELREAASRAEAAPRRPR